MRIVLIVALVALAVWVLISGIRNKWRVSVFGLIVLLVPAGVLSYFEYTYQEDMAQLTQDVTSLVNDPDVGFSCQRMFFSFFDAESGHQTLDVGEKNIKLKYKPCANIVSWMKSDQKNHATEIQIRDLHTLSLEMVRVSGVTNEARQECLAIKNDPIILEKLGASEGVAKSISQYYRDKLVDSRFRQSNLNCV